MIEVSKMLLVPRGVVVPEGESRDGYLKEHILIRMRYDSERVKYLRTMLAGAMWLTTKKVWAITSNAENEELVKQWVKEGLA